MTGKLCIMCGVETNRSMDLCESCEMGDDVFDLYDNPRVVVWFSCGAASAVAAQLTLKEYRDTHETVIAYCDTGAEHESNKLFLKQVEEWLDHPVTILKSEEYTDPWDVFEKTRYLVGKETARCTGELKRKVRLDFQKEDDIQIMGYTADKKELERAVKIRQQFPSVDWEFPLIDHGVNKAQCLSIVQQSNMLDMPEMYKMGYHNNNCIGCPKGGLGYWNKIRVDFPEVFERMAKVERSLGAIDEKTGKPRGVTCGKQYEGKERNRVFLDELDPNAGRHEDTAIQCDILCGDIFTD